MSQNYITKYNVKNFFSFKDDLIKLIYMDGKGASHENIFKTDYFSKQKGEWFNLFSEKVLREFSLWFMKLHKADQLVVEESWYQIYNKNNFHELHTHSGTNFTNVFYLQLPDKKNCTFIEELEAVFKNIRKNSTFIENESVDVLEGSLITFPGFIPHESKPNLSDTPKIIISFNSSIKINE